MLLLNEIEDKIYKNRGILLEEYLPDQLPHRERQIKEISEVTANNLAGDRGKNILCYGHTGVGKTATVHYVMKHLEKEVKEKNVPMTVVNLTSGKNTLVTTIYARIANGVVGRDVVPILGLGRDIAYERMCGALDAAKTNVIAIFDEFDKMYRRFGDEFTYNITRINTDLKNTRLHFIAVTNDTNFVDKAIPSVQSTLRLHNIDFPVYNAVELTNILDPRISEAFQPDVVTQGAVGMAAALAASHNGSARYALDLLSTAGNLARKSGLTRINEDAVYKARDELFVDYHITRMKCLTPHERHTLEALLELGSKEAEVGVEWKRLYDRYTKVCIGYGESPNTTRQFSEYLGEFEQLGIVENELTHHGRARGRSKKIRLKHTWERTKKAFDTVFSDKTQPPSQSR